MMILIKSYPRDDYSLLIGQLFVLRDSRYPIPDRETLKMIDILRDSCNSVKDRKKILPMDDAWTLFSRDIQVYFRNLYASFFRSYVYFGRNYKIVKLSMLWSEVIFNYTYGNEI